MSHEHLPVSRDLEADMERERELRRQAERAVDRKLALYRNVFGGEAGQEVLRDLMAQFSVFKTTAVAGDPHMTHFHEGERNVVLYIAQMMEMDSTNARFLIEQLTAARQDFSAPFTTTGA